MITPETSRTAYCPTGNVNWLKFFPALAFAAGVAVLMACCLHFLRVVGFYFVLVIPALAALVVGCAWMLGLNWSHCRSPRAASGGGVVLGLLLYFGYVHVGLIQLIGVGNAHRIDLLPKFVHFRMKTDVLRDAHAPRDAGNNQGPDRMQQAFNWFFFGGDVLVVIGVIVGTGRKWSSKPYCELCEKWMKSDLLKLSLGSSATLWKALQEGTSPDVDRCLASKVAENAAGSSLTIEYCPACPEHGRTSPVYLTITDGIQLASRAALHPAEVVTLAAAYPNLKGGIADSRLLEKVESAADDIEIAHADQAAEWLGKFARIEAIEEHDAGTILTRQNAILKLLISIVPPIIGLILGGMPFVVLMNRPLAPPEWVFGIAAFWMATCFFFACAWVIFFRHFVPGRFMFGKTRQAFEGRAESAVDLGNPSLIFVAVVPRAHWGKTMMETATDIGFLNLDAERREVVFEGDRQRYWIPAESIIEVKHDFYVEAVQHEYQRSPTFHHFVVLRAMTTTGPWETIFALRQHRFRRTSAKRRLADVLELERQIREILQI